MEPPITGTTVPLGWLTPLTTYYWQVRAVNAGGIWYANDGAIWNFTTPAAPDPSASSARLIAGLSLPPRPRSVGRGARSDRLPVLLRHDGQRELRLGLARRGHRDLGECVRAGAGHDLLLAGGG